MKKSLKIIFWLLIVLNVVLFGVMQAGVLDDGQAAQVLRPVHEEKITLMGSERAQAASAVTLISVVSQPASAPVSAPAAVPLVAKAGTCFEWGDFSGAELDLAAKALKKLSLGEKLSQREIDRVIGFWVYIAPLKDKAAVSHKLAQLKERGVTDYFVVQEAGEWLNAISLGLFKSREAAQKFMDGLRKKGVNSAKMGERTGKSRTTVFIINGLDEQMSDKLTVLQKDFAGSELKMVSCH